MVHGPCPEKGSMDPWSMSCRYLACVSAFTKLPPVFGFGVISPIAALSAFGAPTSSCSNGESSGIVGLCRPQHQRSRSRFHNDQSPKRKYIFPLNIQSKSVRKELKDDLAVLGKAIASSFEQHIPKAILKNVKLKNIVEGKVLQLMTSQINGI